MKIKRLSWAGLQVEGKDSTLYIDPLENVAGMEFFIGKPKFPILEVSQPGTAQANALITHIHPDHFDPDLLIRLISGRGMIYGPSSVVEAGAASGIAISAANLYQTISLGEFEVTPVPAVDWVGDEQVSYVVSDGSQKIFHGGDTNWHGYWWEIKKKYGPFDGAFLPVNGVTGSVPQFIPASDIPGTMSPEQAVTAAKILGAKLLIPMHYAQFNNPPLYSEFENIEQILDDSAKVKQVEIKRLTDGEVLSI